MTRESLNTSENSSSQNKDSKNSLNLNWPDDSAIFKDHFDRLADDVSSSEGLKMVLATSEKLRAAKANEIKFSRPVLTQGENAVIFPHTINLIQGQAGVHKSRLAEIFCSAFLKKHDCSNALLGFRRTNFDTSHTVVYVDTERNLTEQLPYALQSIQINAGFKREDNPATFKYISLLEIKRSERFSVLEEYLTHLKRSTSNPLFIVLDVSTDCIEDFNKTEKSLELIDLMNKAINDHNVIFLCLIHENPKSDKARGHFGTELMNKASTAIQVGFEKDANQNDTEIIRVKYLKCRSTQKHLPFYIRYSQEHKGLVLADESEVGAIQNNRRRKAETGDVIEYLERHLGDGEMIPRSTLIDSLVNDLQAGQRTIEDRLKEIITTEAEIINSQGKKCKLQKVTKDKITFYQIAINEPF